MPLLPGNAPLARSSKIAVWGVLAALFLITSLIIAYPVSFPATLGTLMIVMLAAACWAVVGTILIYLARHKHWPPFPVTVLLAAFLASFFGDDHTLLSTPAAKTPARAPVKEYIEYWFDTRQDWAGGEAKTFPVFVVASEGGGIRSAYWTVRILEELDKSPILRSLLNGRRFRDHVIAFSGVSGSSIGLATLHAAHMGGEKTADDCATQNPGISRAAAALRRDHLAPIVAKLLFADLLRRFLPAIPGDDRADALAFSLQQAWACEFGHHPGPWVTTRAQLEKTGPFTGGHIPPALLMNATSVETGGRVIAGSVALAKDTFPQTLDLAGIIRDTEIGLATAAVSSARFPLISPVGRVPLTEQAAEILCRQFETAMQPHRDTGKADALFRKYQCDRHKRTAAIHVADGGYFENSGALTAAQFVHLVRTALAKRQDKRPGPTDVTIIGVQIFNDPDKARIGSGDLVLFNAGQPVPALTGPFARETGPLTGLMATRGARARLAETDFFNSVSAQLAVTAPPFGKELINSVNTPPLGWSLSGKTAETLDDWAKISACMTAETLVSFLAADRTGLPVTPCISPQTR